MQSRFAYPSARAKHSLRLQEQVARAPASKSERGWSTISVPVRPLGRGKTLCSGLESEVPTPPRVRRSAAAGERDGAASIWSLHALRHSRASASRQRQKQLARVSS